MNAITLSLCHKPVLGVVMWLSFMCVSNQALNDAYVDLAKEGILIDQEIKAPMDERYSLILAFAGPRGSDPATPRRYYFSYFCAHSREAQEAWRTPSQTLALDLEIKASNGQTVRHDVFRPMCHQSFRIPHELFLGNLDLKRGTYRLRIANLHPVAFESEGTVQIRLQGAGAGYP